MDKFTDKQAKKSAFTSNKTSKIKEKAKSKAPNSRLMFFFQKSNLFYLLYLQN